MHPHPQQNDYPYYPDMQQHLATPPQQQQGYAMPPYFPPPQAFDYANSNSDPYIQSQQHLSQGHKIHVGNLPLNITGEELAQVFSKYGPVIDAKIIKKSSQGVPLHMFCYAFVAFETVEAAEAALREGTVNEWSVKAIIDKNKQPAKRQRSRSRSKSRERGKRDRDRDRDRDRHNDHHQRIEHQPQRQYSPVVQQNNNYFYTPPLIEILGTDLVHRRALVPLEQQVEQLESTRPVQQAVTVRELFVTGIPRDKDETFVRQIRQLFSHYGSIEKIDMYPKANIYYTYIKFFNIQAAFDAFENSSYIQSMFTQPQFIKIYYSDPIKRSYIVGNNCSIQAEKSSPLTNVLFVYFPPHPQLKLDMKFMREICIRCNCPIQAWHYNQQDPQYKSYLLLEFEQPSNALLMRDFLAKNIQSIFGEDKCEVGILPDDSNCPQNPQHKQLATQPQFSTRQSQFRQQQQSRMVHPPPRSYEPEQHSTPPQMSPHHLPPQQMFQAPFPLPSTGFGILDELHPDAPYIRKQQQPLHAQPQVHYPPSPYDGMNQYGSDQNLIESLQRYMVDGGQPPQPQQSTQRQQSHAQSVPIQPIHGFDDQEQEHDTFWSGFMMRSKSHRVGVDARPISHSQEVPNLQLPYHLNVAYRSNVEDAVRRAKGGFKFILYPSNETQVKEFEEYIKYFNEKSKVGVVQLDNGAILYVVPPSKEIEPIHKLKNLEMLAIYSDPKTEKKPKPVYGSGANPGVNLNYNPDI